MGNPSNFEGGNNEGTLNTLGQVYRGAVVPVLLGMLLMVLVFSIERFFVISQAAGKTNWTLYDKDTSKYQTR
jgi:biopolymer transport protein ExbB